MPPRRRNTIELCGERLPIFQGGNRRHSHAQLIAYQPSTHSWQSQRALWKWLSNVKQIQKIDTNSKNRATF